jgi:hypothetical protein
MDKFLAGRKGLTKLPFRLKWETTTSPTGKVVAYIASAGFVIAGFTWASSQFFQIRGVQHMLTSRIFLALTIVFVLLGIWGVAWAFFYDRRYVIVAVAGVLLIVAGTALDRAFPMPKAVETKTPYPTVAFTPTPTPSTSQPAPVQTTTPKQPSIPHPPAHPLAGTLASTPPFLTLRFFRSVGEPRFSIVNRGDAAGTTPKWTIAVCDYTNEYYPHYPVDPDSSEPLPVPTTEVDDYVKGHSQMGNFDIFNDASRKIIKPGDQIFGMIGITCMNCPSDSKFWFYWAVGGGGWYAPFTPIPEGLDLFKRPNLSSDKIDALISAVVPIQSRITIPDGNGATLDLTQP